MAYDENLEISGDLYPADQPGTGQPLASTPGLAARKAEELRQRRARKRELSDQLVQVMKENEIDCFDIKNGKILYTQNRVRTALSKRHLMGCLNAYFEAHPNIDGTEIAQYVLEKREVKVKESIRHKLPKGASDQADGQTT